MAAPPLLIADGDIPTTQHLATALRAAFGDVEVRTPATLFGAVVSGRRVFVSRLCHPRYSWLPRYLTTKGVAYYYLLDDNFWALTDEVDSHLAAHYQSPAVLNTLEVFIRSARGILVWSRILGREITRMFPEAHILPIPPHVDLNLIASLKVPAPGVTKAPRVPVRIGYPSTPRPSVEKLLVELVTEIARKHRGAVEFEFFGWIPLALAGEPWVRFLPPVDRYEDFLRTKLSRGWALGLAPLVEGPFDRCKTSLKYREYGGCGIAGVYSDVEPFRGDMAQGVTGLLVENRADAWVAAIDSLLADPERVDAIADAAAKDVASRFTLEASSRALLALT